jgi:ribonuclease III
LSAFATLEKKLNYRFTNAALLRQALTHRSHSVSHYERLEFVGDSVLNLVIAQALFSQFPQLPEGDLSRLRAHLVSQEPLHQLALSLYLGDYLILGDGARKSGGRHTPSILADAVESIFGAVCLDTDFLTARDLILRLYAPQLQHLDPHIAGKDSKTRLQELLQGKKLPLPRYDVMLTEGLDHAQTFTVSCAVPTYKLTTQGTGATRRLAEQAAATEALKAITP